MMRLVTVGALKDRLYKQLVERYLSRLGRFVRCEWIQVKKVSHPDPAVVKAREGAALLDRVDTNRQRGYLIACDPSGRTLGTEQLAATLKQHQFETVVFAVGGAFGLGPAVVKRADLKLSLSALTLPHDLALLVLAEQLYRAQTIINHHPYHKS